MIRESLAHTPLTKIHRTAAADCYCLCGSAACNQSSGDWNWKIDVVLVEIERWKKDEERVVRATLRRRIRTWKRKRNERITQSAQRTARTHTRDFLFETNIQFNWYLCAPFNGELSWSNVCVGKEHSASEINYVHTQIHWHCHHWRRTQMNKLLHTLDSTAHNWLTAITLCHNSEILMLKKCSFCSWFVLFYVFDATLSVFSLTVYCVYVFLSDTDEYLFATDVLLMMFYVRMCVCVSNLSKDKHIA